ncbi:MAG: GumN family protein [Caulobacteraceae bacterium]|nr:GumN family protein [Caulobacteraceae bacterium]
MRRLLTALAAGCLLTGSAAAQDLPFDQPDDLVSALVVKARTPGPAWWKVSDADTTIWILGSPGLLPESIKWDDSALKRRLTGANRLILPPRENASLVGTITLVAGIKKVIFDPRQASDRLPPALFQRLKSRFSDGGRDDVVFGITISNHGVGISAKKAAPSEKAGSGQDFGTNALKTIILALLAQRLADAPLGELADEPATRAEALATSLKTPRLRAGAYDELAAFKAGAALPESAQQACLVGGLDLLDAQDANVATKRAHAQAWADGDIPAALGRGDRYDMQGACPTPAPVKAMAARNTAAAASAIRAELRKPGHAVAVIDLPDLLQVGGVLDQLRVVKGVTVTAPDGLDD